MVRLSLFFVAKDRNLKFCACFRFVVVQRKRLTPAIRTPLRRLP